MKNYRNKTGKKYLSMNLKKRWMILVTFLFINTIYWLKIFQIFIYFYSIININDDDNQQVIIKSEFIYKKKLSKTCPKVFRNLVCRIEWWKYKKSGYHTHTHTNYHFCFFWILWRIIAHTLSTWTHYHHHHDHSYIVAIFIFRLYIYDMSIRIIHKHIYTSIKSKRMTPMKI